MKTLTFALAMVSAAGVFGQSVRIPEHPGGPGVDGEYNQYYSPNNEIAITGTVVGKVKGTPSNGKAEGVSVLVKTAAGRVYSVDLGPAWFVGAQAVKISTGDHVRVVGSGIAFRNGESVLLARQIFDRREILSLRDNSGKPYWLAYQQEQIPPGLSNKETGTIVSMNPVTVDNQQQHGIQMQTGQGLLDLAVAPDWYLQELGIGFKLGDSATIYYGPGPVRFGPAIIMSGTYWPASYVPVSFIPSTGR